MVVNSVWRWDQTGKEHGRNLWILHVSGSYMGPYTVIKINQAVCLRLVYSMNCRVHELMLVLNFLNPDGKILIDGQ